MTEKSELSTKQKKTIAALLTYPTIEKAAASVPVGSNTIRKWRKKDPAFAEALERAETEMITTASRAIATGAVEAIAVLRDALDSDDRSERRKAASVLLRSTPGMRLLGSIEAKIEKLLEQK